MVKASCCVPRCTNNWRNSPNMKFHTLPSDPKILGMYEKLIRNANLKKDSSSTRICGAHFPQGERMSRTQLPSIFPWTSVPQERRKIERVQVPMVKRPRTTSVQAEKENVEDYENPSDITTNNVSMDVQEEKFRDQSTQTDSLNESQSLQQEILALKEKIQSLETTIHELNSKPKFELSDHKDKDHDIAFYTGFPNYDTLLLCYDLLKEKAEHLCYQNRDETEYHPAEYNKPGSKRKLTIWQELTIVLLRLRLGLLEKDLAERFRISMPTVSVIWRTWIKFMRKELEPVCIQWPSKDQIVHFMPPVFKTFYPDLVSIIDCTEIQMESPSSLDNRSLCYSSYKSRTTMKALIGITPNGVVSFCSDLYCGSISDIQIVKESGYLSHLNRGDTVMADKGFTIQDELAEVGAKLAMPHFLKGKAQFSKQESDHNKKIASLRIHVERYMERLKNWHFFDRPVPITISTIASDVWVVVACLSNFLPPIIA